jgi:sulfur-oxidizing protein SoxY
LGLKQPKKAAIPAAQNGQFSRRIALKFCAAGVVISASPARAQSLALTTTQRAAVANIVSGNVALDAMISLIVEPLAETGNAIPIRVMSPNSEVMRWIVVAEKNPRPIVFEATVGALAARSPLSTRVRLAATQNLLALAQTRDGAWHGAQANVALTASACYDGT